MDSLRKAIQQEFPKATVTNLITQTSGAFEMSINGKLAYSRLKSFLYPDPEEILILLRDVKAGKPIPVIE